MSKLYPHKVTQSWYFLLSLFNIRCLTFNNTLTEEIVKHIFCVTAKTFGHFSIIQSSQTVFGTTAATIIHFCRWLFSLPVAIFYTVFQNPWEESWEFESVKLPFFLYPKMLKIENYLFVLKSDLRSADKISRPHALRIPNVCCLTHIKTNT